MNDLPERANMPLISAAALKAQSNYPPALKQSTSKPKPAIISVCKTCGKEYNKRLASSTLEKLPTLENINYQDNCLNCIKEQSLAIKALRQPAIKEIKASLDESSLAYQEAYNQWQFMAKEYQALDYQEHMIDHSIKQSIKKPASATNKLKDKAKTINEAAAMKILANLSPEQREGLLALM